MPTNQTHTLTTIADLLRIVTIDNVDALATDMRGMLINAAATKAMLAAAGADPDDVANFTTSTTWTDDGVNKQVIQVEFPDGNSLDFVTTGKDHH